MTQRKFMPPKGIVIAALCAGICFLVGFLASFQMPKVRSWILVKVEEASRDQLPFRVLPGAIEVNFFPLGTTLKNVKIIPKDEIKAFLDPLEIESLSVAISPWQLAQGRLRLNDVALEGAKISVRVPKTEKKSGPPLDGLFKLLDSLPISRLNLDRIALKLRLADPRMAVDIGELTLAAHKRRGALLLDVTTSSVFVREAETNANVRVDLEASILASPDAVTVTAIKVRRGDSFVVASGRLQGKTEALSFPDLELSARSELHLESMRNWAVKTFPDYSKMPQLRGRAFLEAKVGRKDGKSPEADFKARAEGLGIDQFLLDKVETAGTFKDGVIKLPKATIDNPGAAVELTNTIVHSEGDGRIESQAKISNLDLHELLKTLGVGEIPLWLRVNSSFPCSGHVKPSFNLTCRGQAKGENLLLRDAMKSKSTIVAIRQFDATGEFTVDADKVTYKTELKMPNSKGRSSGTIGFATGFKIGYEADLLSMKDVANLADLRIEGTAKIKGTTEGDSDAATMRMDLDGAEMWFEDFWLGYPRGTISYKDAILDFQGVQGHYTVSRYNGDVRVDLHKKELTVNGRVPFFDAKDLLTIFSRKFTLPVPLTGTGQAQVKVSGPFEFTKLSYELKSSLFRGSVAGETFDQANFDVRAKNGEVTADRVQLLKGPAVVSLTGQGHPDGTIKTVLRGRGLRLEDSNTVVNSGLSLSGLVDFDMDLTGPVLAPDTNLRGVLTKTSIGDQAMPDSNFRLKFTKHTIEGGGTFLGDVVKADFTIPLEAEAPFALKLTSQEWNFAPIFASISGPGARKDYEGRLTSTIDISAPTGGFWNASGSAQIAKFSLARGPLAIRSSEPLSLSMKNGQLHVQKFNLVGENTFLKLSDNANPVSKVDLQVNGKLDLSLMALVLPFFEDLRGILTFAFNVRAGPGTSDILGSAYVEKGYLKFFDFPHPFEDISADILFNQKKVLFNTVRSEFGGGRLSASGAMELKGYKNYPLNVSGTFDKVTLNIPDKVKTSGDGHFSMTGHWFPFLLKGTYEVKDGMMTKEFGGETSASDGIRRSYFLPEILLQDNFVPLLVDLDIDFTRGLGVKNDMVEGRVLGNLSVKGNPTKPSVLGSVTTDKDTTIIFKDAVFEVTSANIQFTDPNEINPRLYVAARSRIQDHDINLLVQGTGSKPDILLSSVPPLPDKDIISLLALGVTDTNLNEKVASDQQTASTGMQVGSTMLSKNPIGKEIKDRFGLDLQFSPGFDDSNSAVQKIIVSRQVTPKLGVTYSRSLGKTGENEAKVRYRLNERFSLVGSWQGREYEETTDATSLNTEKNPNKIGLDVEYKFEFK